MAVRKQTASRQEEERETVPILLEAVSVLWIVAALAVFLSDEKIQQWISSALATIARSAGG